MSLATQILEAATPVDQDLVITRGDSPRVRFVVRVKENGNPQPIGTGVSCELVLYDATGDTVLLTKSGTVDDQANGTGYIDLTTSETAGLPFPTQDDDSTQQAVVGRWVIALTEGSVRKTVGKGNLVVFSPTDP